LTLARPVLKRLIDKGWVREEGRPRASADKAKQTKAGQRYHPGMKLYYSLTPKGKLEHMRRAVSRVTESLNDYQVVLARIATDPVSLEEWRAHSYESVKALIQKHADAPVRQRVKLANDLLHEIDAPFTDTLRTMHTLFLRAMRLEQGGEVFIYPGKRGGAFLIPVQLLIKEEREEFPGLKEFIQINEP
jgi:hypothetical protein